MKWSDLITIVSAGVAEDISDNSQDFFKKYQLKLYAAAQQTMISRTVLCLERYYSFDTTSSEELYIIPNDFIQARSVRYKDQYYLGELIKRPKIAPDVYSNPINFYITNKLIGLYPTPSADGEEIVMWYWGLAAPYGLRIKHFASSAVSEITLSVDNNVMTFEVTGGTNAGTYTFDFTDTTNDTLTKLISSINDTALLQDEVYATLGTSQNGDDSSAKLEEFSSVSIKHTNRCYFLEPEIPEEMQVEILVPAMLHQLKAQDREIKLSMMYYEKMMVGMQRFETLYKERFHGSRNLVVGESSMPDVRPSRLGSNGFIIVP